MSSLQLTFFVAGDPKPKGSTKAFPFKGKDGRTHVSTTNANPGTKPWQERVAAMAQHEMQGKPFLGDGPVWLDTMFYLPRPKYLDQKKYRDRKVYPIIKKKSDVDKLLRAVMDGLTGVVFDDDAQVVGGTFDKDYAPPGSPPGVLISVSTSRPREGER